MLTLQYDGSLDGLLCAISSALEIGDPIQLQSTAGGARQGMLFDTQAVPSDADSANRLLQTLEDAGGKQTVRSLLRAFLAETPQRDDLLMQAVSEVLQARCPLENLASQAAHNLLKTVRQVGHEIHRMHGLLRFSELADGTFYAPMEPDHNVLIPVAIHFTTRLRDRHWVIHDQTRDLAIHWNSSKLHPVDQPNTATQNLALAEDEATYRACWQTYTRHIALENRRNPRLQRQFMPRRYWRHLTEMQTPNHQNP